MKRGQGVKARAGELLESREMLYFLVWRDVKVRYRQAWLGALWVVLQPVATVCVYSFIFSTFVRFPEEGVPYHLYVFIGLWPWLYFSGVVSDSGNSLVANAHLITKVYFPRIFLPTSRLLALMSDFLVMGILLFAMLLYYGYYPSWIWLWLLFLVFLTVLLTFSVTIFYSALNVKYRDFHFVMPFVVQLWMFCSPIIYSRDILPDNYKFILSFNPMVGIIESFHSVLLYCFIDYSSLLYPSAVSVFLFIISVKYFTSVECEFSDIL